jgi:hypothetical protein
MTWQPIETAPRDGTEVIVWCEFAATEFVHIAWYRSADDFHANMFPIEGERIEDYVGWWSYVTNSVGQEKLTGHKEPKAWMPLPEPHKEEA